MYSILFCPNSLYIYHKARYTIRDKLSDTIVFCDPTDKNWIFMLINAFEMWCSSQLSCTIIHGSLFVYKDVGVILSGKRKSGKTTLLKYFTEQLDVKYIDDDSVYYIKNSYWGFNLPVSMRENGGNNNVMLTFDEEAHPRYLFFYDQAKRIGHTEKVDYILFPEYSSEEAMLKIEKLPSSVVFNRLMNNIRGYKGIQNLYNDVSAIVSSTEAYSIKYCHCEQGLEFIEHLRCPERL